MSGDVDGSHEAYLRQLAEARARIDGQMRSAVALALDDGCSVRSVADWSGLHRQTVSRIGAAGE